MYKDVITIEVLKMSIKELLNEINPEDFKPYNKYEAMKHPENKGMDKG